MSINFGVLQLCALLTCLSLAICTEELTVSEALTDDQPPFMEATLQSITRLDQGISTVVVHRASGEAGVFKSFKGWPSDVSLMSSGAVCDQECCKAKLSAGEGYYYDSGQAGGFCRSIPVQNVAKLLAAHASGQWSGSDHTTGKVYLPVRSDCLATNLFLPKQVTAAAGVFKSFKGWPSDLLLMSSPTSPCDQECCKAKISAGEGYYYDSATPGGYCKILAVQNVAKVLAAHASGQWSGSDQTTGNAYLPVRADCLVFLPKQVGPKEHGFKSINGWPSNTSLMSNHTSPCDENCCKDEIWGWEGYNYDSGQAGGFCRSIPFKNVAKVLAAHASGQWSGSDQTTAKTYLPVRKHDSSAAARCSSTVDGTEPGTMDCHPAQEACFTMHSGEPTHLNGPMWTEKVHPKVHASYCKEQFDPVHKAKVACPDGIGPTGYFVSQIKYHGADEDGKLFDGACEKWETGPVGKTRCDHHDPFLAKACTKSKVTHMQGNHGRSVGALLLKRNICDGSSCSEWKVGRCIDVKGLTGEDPIWKCTHMLVGNHVCPHVEYITDMAESVKRFARLAVEAMKTYPAYLETLWANEAAGLETPAWEYACDKEAEKSLELEVRMH